jgi:predicted transcriptional regulator
MADPDVRDPFAFVEEEVEVDDETLAAIDEGIEAADQGLLTPADEVPALIAKWISEFSTPSRR